MERRLRMLLSRDDGHDRGYWVIANIMRNAGIEVVLGGVQIPRQIVQTAIQEDVDMIGYRIMQAAPKVLVPILIQKMKENGIGDIPVLVGGIIPQKDEDLIRQMGVKEVFHPLTPLDTIVETVISIGRSAALAKSK